ncbi:uncharacterized protein [Amphiura filiformis]|uniref:uncharacterized protein n=1 Tax=Amphiura filiformis TaxID=82378 RepID=UPI003B21C023
MSAFRILAIVLGIYICLQIVCCQETSKYVPVETETETWALTSSKASTNTTSMTITNDDLATTISTISSVTFDQTGADTEIAPPTTKQTLPSSPSSSTSRFEVTSTVSTTYPVTIDQTYVNTKTAPPTAKQITSSSASSSSSFEVTNNIVTSVDQLHKKTNIFTNSDQTTGLKDRFTKYEDHGGSTEVKTSTLSDSTTSTQDMPTTRVPNRVPRSTSDADLPSTLDTSGLATRSQEPSWIDNQAILIVLMAFSLSLGLINCVLIFTCSMVWKNRFDSYTKGPICVTGNGKKPPTQDSGSTTKPKDETKDGDETSQSKEKIIQPNGDNITNADEVNEADTWLFSSVASQPSTGLMAYSTSLEIEKQSDIDETPKSDVKIEMIGMDGNATFYETKL